MRTLSLCGGHFLGVTVVQVSGPCLDMSKKITCAWWAGNWGSVCQHNSGSVSLSTPDDNWGVTIPIGCGQCWWKYQISEFFSCKHRIIYSNYCICLHISKCSILHDCTARIDPCVFLHLQCHLMKDLGLYWMHPVCCSCLNCTQNYLVTWDGGSILGVDLYTVAIRLYCFNNESASHLSNTGQVGIILSSLMYAFLAYKSA